MWSNYTEEFFNFYVCQPSLYFLKSFKKFLRKWKEGTVIQYNQTNIIVVLFVCILPDPRIGMLKEARGRSVRNAGTQMGGELLGRYSYRKLIPTYDNHSVKRVNNVWFTKYFTENHIFMYISFNFLKRNHLRSN